LPLGLGNWKGSDPLLTLVLWPQPYRLYLYVPFHATQFSTPTSSILVLYISNFKVLEKQSFSICFPLAGCLMGISFHFFCKVYTTNINMFFAWYLYISCKEDVYIYCTNFAKKMEQNSRNLFTLIPHVLRASPFHIYHTIKTHITTPNTPNTVGDEL
jgi:hypothetical protein